MILQPWPGGGGVGGAEHPVIDGEETLHGCGTAEIFIFRQGRSQGHSVKTEKLFSKKRGKHTWPAFCHVPILYMRQKKQACTSHR